MAETFTKAGADRFEVRVTADSHFAWIRTRLSLERTMMSWIRTATALIGFGFAIVQYLSHLVQAPGARAAVVPDAPRYLGLALIGSGVVALLISIWQYQWGIRYLTSGSFSVIAGVREGGMHTPVMAIAVLLIFIGLFAFFAVLFHLA
jgi:putative membrane protein